MGQTGAKGDTGAAATVQVGNTNTGAPGTNAQVTNAGNEHFAVFNFTIPRGDKGEKGATGAQGAKGDKGDKGDTGTAATITVGSTTTTNPGTNATVTNSGTTSAAVLNFGIPRGATGSVKSEVVSELPETGEGDTFYLVNREATTQTATGKAINFTNSDNSGNITDFKLDGETSQNGTPTPDAPVAVQTVTGDNVVEICGKNLWGGVLVAGGIDISNGNITLANDRVRTKDYVRVSQNTAYTISGIRATRWAIFYDWNKTYAGYTQVDASQTSGTITIPQGVSYLRWYIVSGNNDTSIQEQLELGSTATTYEPYQGQGYQVGLRGKNWLDISSFVLGGMANGNPDPNTKYRINNAANPIAVEPNTKYTISAQLVSPVLGYRIGIHECGAAGDFIMDLGWQQLASSAYTFTTGATTYYIKIVGSLSTTSTDVTTGSSENTTACSSVTEFMRGCTLQFEAGESATQYEAYYNIELCKIGDYQDYIYKSGGKWYVHKETGVLAVDASTITSSGTAYSNIVYGQVIKNDDAKNKGAYTHYVGLCSHAIWSGNASNWNSADNAGKCYDAANGSKYWIGFASGTSLDDIKTALSGCKIVYPLATPTDTEITNEALIAQLDNVASAPLYTGVNNITTITPNEQGTLEIKYVTYDKYNQNKVYIWNDTLQQWQIIVQ
jgi:hypothetical protein